MSFATQYRFIEQQLKHFQQQLDGLIAPTWPLDVRIVLRHFYEHLFDPDLTAGKAIKRCGVRSHSFSLHFKCCCRTTPGRYIEDLRMMAALRLLSFDELEAGMIAVQIGYSDHSVFARAFRRHFGCTPTGFREQTEKEQHAPEWIDRETFMELVGAGGGHRTFAERRSCLSKAGSPANANQGLKR